MNFASDNTAGAASEIIAALVAANQDAVPAYGSDELTKQVEVQLAEFFEHDIAVFFVATGSAANSLALAAIVPPWGAIYCHKNSHINSDECGAPEFFTAGAKLVSLNGEDGKITPFLIAAALGGQAGIVHHVQPAAISISQATEAGTVYTIDEIAALADIAKAHRLGLHMDGARFANALASLNASAADITWRCGVDVLSLGATKNGALAAEVIVFFDPAKAVDFGYRRKRGGHLLSKHRFITAQFYGWLENQNWRRYATHANSMALRLAAGLRSIPHVRFIYPVEANEIFVSIPGQMRDQLRMAGFVFYDWPDAGPDAVRLVTSFATKREDVDYFIATAINAVMSNSN